MMPRHASELYTAKLRGSHLIMRTVCVAKVMDSHLVIPHDHVLRTIPIQVLYPLLYSFCACRGLSVLLLHIFPSAFGFVFHLSPNFFHLCFPLASRRSPLVLQCIFICLPFLSIFLRLTPSLSCTRAFSFGFQSYLSPICF